MKNFSKTEEKYADANGIQLAYDTFGKPDDSPIILIMGLGMQMTAWDELFCEHIASRDFYVIRFDNRDIGHSTKFDSFQNPGILKMLSAGLFHRPLPAPYLLKDMAADTAGLMDALNIQAAHVAGVSMGGMIAQEMAISHPKRLLSITSIMSTTGDPTLPKAALSVRLRLLKRAPGEERAYVNHMINLFKLLNGPYYPFDESRYRQQLARSFNRGYYPKGVSRQLTAVIASGNRKEKLNSIATPALVIHGDSDPLIPMAHGLATAYAIPNATLHIMKGMGHTMPQEAWPEMIDAIAAHAGTV